MPMNSRFAKRIARVLAIVPALVMALALPAHAAVTTVYSCGSLGIGGNHDYVFNGFFVQNVAAANLHSVQIYYTATSGGLYNLTLTVHTGGYNGPVVGSQTQNIGLNSSSESAVTWDFPDPAITSGTTLYFEHTGSGVSGAQFSTRSSGCPGNVENAGLSGIDNGFSVAVVITTNSTPPPPACVGNSTTLCLDNQPGDKRFQVRATYATSQSGGVSGNGRAIQTNSLGVTQGGLFWFFDAKNPELLVKVLNGCPLNNKFWVFYAATTNVGFHITVTDVVTGHFKVYDNADLTPAPPVQDTSALACP